LLKVALNTHSPNGIKMTWSFMRTINDMITEKYTVLVVIDKLF